MRPPSFRGIATALVLAMSAMTGPAHAQTVTRDTLLDRIQVEDLLVRYYYDLTMGRAHEMSEYFTEDALLDVDGKWLISRRYISSDSGTPDRFDATFKQRENPLGD